MTRWLALFALTVTPPPILVILPDGSEIAADRVEYDLDGQTVRVFHDGIFADGFE